MLRPTVPLRSIVLHLLTVRHLHTARHRLSIALLTILLLHIIRITTDTVLGQGSGDFRLTHASTTMPVLTIISMTASITATIHTEATTSAARLWERFSQEMCLMQ